MTIAPELARRAPGAAGTRSRAGNAMGRTQVALVDGVGRCLGEHGFRRTTMVDIARAAGIAKGTLYNHVRTKSEAVGLYLDDQIAQLAGLLDGEPAAALSAAAERVAAHPAGRRLAAEEPASVAVLLAGAATSSRAAPVREALERLVGLAAAPLALRWLGSLLLDPGSAAERATTAALLAAGG